MNERVRREGGLLIACCLFSLMALVASYLAQYVWKIEPCRLCKLQRLPYFLIVMMPLVVLLKVRYEIIGKFVICIFSISALLSLYHLLVIYGLIDDFCAVKTRVENIEDFMALLDTHVPCSEANWRLFKLPIAGYNLLASLGFIYLWSTQALKRFPYQQTSL
jgi:disulfide bond formation protein DsbB